MKTLTQDRDNIQLLYEQATDEIQRLRRQVSRARSPSPSRAASAVLVRVESERDAALADVRRSNIQLDNLEDKLKVCCRENPIPSVRLSRTNFNLRGDPAISLRTADAFPVVASLPSNFSEGQKRRPEMRLLFAGYPAIRPPQFFPTATLFFPGKCPFFIRKPWPKTTLKNTGVYVLLKIYFVNTVT